jgi:hypothetical protein
MVVAMTGIEAKKKVCPARSLMIGLLFVAKREIVGSDSPDKCIGSNCMMWRYVHPEYLIVEDKKDDEQLNGYCGLAGKP